MGTDLRRHPRYGVHLSVRYANAEQFVTDYVENLSTGGLFIAGANRLPLFAETDVDIELPGQGSWKVRAKSVFIIDEAAAKRSGRREGAGMEIIDKPAGFDDALLGYLLRLGQRRDHSIMVGEVPGVRLFADAGYRVIPLEPPEKAATLADDTLVKLLAVVVPPDTVAAYRQALGDRGQDLVYGITSDEQIQDVLARVDSLLG
jgi:hypothetical protein